MARVHEVLIIGSGIGGSVAAARLAVASAVLSAGDQLGVMDGRGEVHDHPGLFVVDAAALPAAPGGPPSMTIAAWASWVVERFLEQRA